MIKAGPGVRVHGMLLVRGRSVTEIPNVLGDAGGLSRREIVERDDGTPRSGPKMWKSPILAIPALLVVETTVIFAYLASSLGNGTSEPDIRGDGAVDHGMEIGIRGRAVGEGQREGETLSVTVDAGEADDVGSGPAAELYDYALVRG